MNQKRPTFSCKSFFCPELNEYIPEYYSINNSSMLSAISYKTPNSTSIGVDS